MIIGISLGELLLAVGLIALYRVHSSHKAEEENTTRIEKFLEDYKAVKPTRYLYTDLKITDEFKDKLGQGAYGTIYKGKLSDDIFVKLSDDIFVAVKLLNYSTGNGDDFIDEVGMMGRIHHVNVVRLIGYCADGYRTALVYQYLPNESLEKFTFSNQGNPLSWEKLKEIALGIAKEIEYLHQVCVYQILHFDIQSHNILLDHNFNTKVSDFGLAKLCSKDQSMVSMTTARGTMGYIAPELLSRNFGNVSNKSDVYSYGMAVLEMVGGRKNTDDKVHFQEGAYRRMDQGQDLRMPIEDTSTRDAEIAKKLTIIGLWCIQWHPVDRPSMKTVLQMLEGRINKLTMPNNPFASRAPIRGLRQNLEMIRE